MNFFFVFVLKENRRLRKSIIIVGICFHLIVLIFSLFFFVNLICLNWEKMDIRELKGKIS